MDSGSVGDGAVAVDASRPADAAAQPDAGGADGGMTPVDAGAMAMDAGPARIDAGPTPVDAGHDAGTPGCRGDVDCNDSVACTLDRCVMGMCTHMAADADGDGHTVAACPGGDDCNDMASAIHPGAAEVCDGLDNDCSGAADDSGGLECVLGSAAAACTTACMTAGTQPCNALCHRGPCYAPAEVCGNMCDDNGVGGIDEGCMTTGPTNDTCTTGIDVTANGSFSGNTCGADDTLALGTGAPGCGTPAGPAGTPDVFYLIRTRPAGSNYTLTITSGFVIQFVPSVCTGNGGCGPWSTPMGPTFTISGGGGTTWYFAIERSGGGCGAFTLNVTGS